MTRFQQLLSFKGRTSRLGYWRIYLGCTALIALFWCAGLALALALQIGGLSAIALAGTAPVLVVEAAMLVRRLHDRGKSAWWLCLFYGVPLALFAAARLSSGPETAADARSGLAGVRDWPGRRSGSGGFVELGVLRGATVANRFGPAPAS